MKFVSAQVAYFLQNRKAKTNIGRLLKFVAILFLLIVVYSVLFHILMEHEGQKFSWLTGFYWTLTVMSNAWLRRYNLRVRSGQTFFHGGAAVWYCIPAGTAALYLHSVFFMHPGSRRRTGVKLHWSWMKTWKGMFLSLIMIQLPEPLSQNLRITVINTLYLSVIFSRL